MNIFLVGLGGFLGSITRYYIGTLLQQKIIATLIINVTGAILLAYSTHLYLIGDISQALWLFAGSGFSGAYTTFSTFGYETLYLILEQKHKHVLLYVTASLIISMFTVWPMLSLLNASEILLNII